MADLSNMFNRSTPEFENVDDWDTKQVTDLTKIGKNMKLNSNNTVAKCPKCGNNTEFEVHSSQVAEDCCEVWVVCICGFDPTSELLGSRYEDVWGGIDSAKILMALDCWNYAIGGGMHEAMGTREPDT